MRGTSDDLILNIQNVRKAFARHCEVCEITHNCLPDRQLAPFIWWYYKQWNWFNLEALFNAYHNHAQLLLFNYTSFSAYINNICVLNTQKIELNQASHSLLQLIPYSIALLPRPGMLFNLLFQNVMLKHFQVAVRIIHLQRP